MKSKLTITVASILSVLVLVGVGFAAWVISNPNVEAKQTGNIEVDTVTDYSYDIKAEFVKTTDANNGTIVFGKKDDSSITAPWLTNNAKAENLTAKLTLTAQNFQAASWENIKTKTLIVSMKTVKKAAEGGEASNDSGFATLVSNNYITYPTLSGKGITSGALADWDGTVEIKLSDFTYVKGETTATYELTIAFAWGSHFTSEGAVVNPYTYYNKQDYSTTLAKDANTALTAINTNLSGVTYQVNITEKKASA